MIDDSSTNSDFTEDFDGEIESIAIIGMSGRFPKAKDIDTFWENLCAGQESLTYFTSEELIAAGQNPTLVNAPNYVKARHILDNVDLFDADFFDIPPSEAEIMDPQHRLFLECAWEALEAAGYDPFADEGLTSVFAGAGTNNYLLTNLWTNRALLAQMGNMSLGTASSRDFLPTRVAYKLNLKGASFNVQSACSTALVATHLACQHLLTYQCDMALAGGATVSPQAVGYLYQEGGPASPDGHCRPFDDHAQGTVFSNAVGVIVLKRLSEAVADGDYIYGVIRGTAINNDGASKVGFTAPSVEGELRVILAAQEAADVDLETITYIETHGTGTILGDPIEIEALTQAFRQKTDKKQFCAIGSVKSNIGHADAAAGICGMIKTALALKHKQIPPSINYEKPNAKIDFARTPFFVNTELREWESNGTPRHAAVSAFGFGGTNAHIILEEAPPLQETTPSRRYQMLILSARTETALETMTDNLARHLQAHSELNLADIAYTLHMGRVGFSHRRVILCATTEEAVTALETRDAARLWNGSPGQEQRTVAFLFSGQGSQYVNMGRDLYEQEPVFREQIDTCAALLRPHLGLDLRNILYPDNQADLEETQITQTWLAQPALFTVEYALAHLLLSWGIQPQAMIGHSIGEYVAACLSGVFSLEDALAMVTVRGQLMQKMMPGSMLSVSLTEAELRPYLPADIDLAANNAPNLCVVAGPTERINAFAAQLEEDGITVRPLHTSHAFHSHMMEPMLETFTQRLRHIQFNPPQVPYISNVTGDWITAEQATDPDYWAQHVRHAVRFADGVHLLAQMSEVILLEVGPGTALRTLAQRHPSRTITQAVLATMRHPQEEQDDDYVLLKTVGHLWLNGVSPQWSGYYTQEFRHRAPLPTYPFERRRFWIEPDQGYKPQVDTLLKRHDLQEWFYIPSWKHTLAPVLEQPQTTQNWLIFHNEDVLSMAVMQQLEMLGFSATRVQAGTTPAVNGTTFVIRPAAPEDYEMLWQTLQEQGNLPTHILHLWNTSSTLSADVLERSFYSVLYTAQAISKIANMKDVWLGVVTSYAQHMIGDTHTLHPEKATVQGVCKVIPQEIAAIHCRCIDVLGTNPPVLAAQLIADISKEIDEQVVVYREGERWVQTYETTPVPDTTRVLKTGLRPQGVYLITGGLGGIGLVLAEYLAQTVQARLVLIARTPLPARRTWEDWLATHADTDRTSERIRKVWAMEALGAEVLIVTADVADEAAMREGVATAVSHFGTIHGVIHAAGVPGGGIIQLKTAAAAQAVLDPKVKGTRHLETTLADQTPDFILLCSSLASVVGGVGQVDYCAANAFMDTYAAAYNGYRGIQVVSVNWDTWAEVGMAVNTNPISPTVTVSPSITKTPVNHPLLQEMYIADTGETVYELTLDPSQHWVLADHLVMGIPTAPATVHLELIQATLTDKIGQQGFLISEAIFVTPLMVNEGTVKQVEIWLTEKGSTIHFRVQSQAGIAANGSVQWETHVMGEASIAPPPRPAAYDLHAIINRCTPRDIPPLPKDTEEVRRSRILFGPRWHSLRHAFSGTHEAIAEIELSDDIKSDVQTYRLHPALLDIATSFSIGAESDGLYLPLSYQNLIVYQPLPAHIYSYVQRDPVQQEGQEIMMVTVTIMDEQGEVVAEVESFAAKRVRISAAAQLRQNRNSDNLAFSRDFSMAILPSEGQEIFARILARTHTPQVIVSTRNLPAVIAQVQMMQENFLRQVDKLNTARIPKHARPHLSTIYVAPRNKVERTITHIWANVLGLAEIGIHDNFFELGGESILGIQIVAQLRDAGLTASPDQIFQNQTIAELAQALQPNLDSAETAVLQITPLQTRLLQASIYQPHLLMLQTTEPLQSQILGQAFTHVWLHYDALQASFHQVDGDWQIEVSAPPAEPMLTTASLVETGAGGRDEIQAELARLQHGFITPAQPLLRGVYLQSGADEADYLLIAISPLVADVASIPILLQDIMLAYEQLVRGETVTLPPVTATYATWSKAWTAMQPPEGAVVLPDWQDIPALPTADSRNEHGIWQKLSITLPPETSSRLQQVPDTYHVQPEELILAALAQTVSDWSGNSQMILDWTQRPPLPIDLDRAIGPLDITYPVRLDLSQPQDATILIAEVKEQIRLLTATEMAQRQSMPPAQVALSYHPDIFDENELHLLEFHRALDTAVPRLHIVVGYVASQMQMVWHYHTALYPKQTVKALADALEKAILRLVDHCMTSEQVQFTPSDFPDAGLDQQMLNQFIAKLTKK